MKLTKEQREQIEQELGGLFGRVTLRCDGYEVVAAVKTVARFRQAILVYVDGYIKGEWFRGESEIPRKFHRESKRHVFTKAARENAAAQLKKRVVRAMPDWKKHYEEQLDKQLTFWYSDWGSPKAFLRHITQTCDSIELIKIGFQD